jgi:NADPH-dependent curcumin reductase CurA
VGIIAGQISRIKGCRVVGIAGSKEKINYLKEELQFDEAYDYHESDWEAKFATAVPQGVNVYFDNVGGAVSDVILRNLNQRARIIICGQISLYNSTEQPSGPRVQPILLEKRALMQGFTVRDYDEHFNEAIEELSKWMKEGKLRSRETVFKGFEKLPEAFIGLFQGKNTGKCLVEL